MPQHVERRTMLGLELGSIFVKLKVCFRKLIKLFHSCGSSLRKLLSPFNMVN